MSAQCASTLGLPLMPRNLPNGFFAQLISDRAEEFLVSGYAFYIPEKAQCVCRLSFDAQADSTILPERHSQAGTPEEARDMIAAYIIRTSLEKAKAKAEMLRFRLRRRQGQWKQAPLFWSVFASQCANAKNGGQRVRWCL